MTSPSPNVQNNFSDISLALMNDLHLTNAQAYGVLGNLQVESGYNQYAMSPNDGGPGVNAYGIAQWEGGRYTNLVNYAKAHGGDPTNIDTQIGFLVSELEGPYSSTLSLLRTATNPAQAALYFSQGANGVRGYEGNTAASVPERESIATKLATDPHYNPFTGNEDANTGGTNPAVNNAIYGPIAGGAVSAGTGVVNAIESTGQFLGWIVGNATSKDFWIRVGFIILGLLLLVIAVDKITSGGLTGSSSSSSGSGPVGQTVHIVPADKVLEAGEA